VAKVSPRRGPARCAAAPHGRKRLGNRVVEEIELTGDALDLIGDGLTMIACSAEPGSGRGPAEAADHPAAPPQTRLVGRQSSSTVRCLSWIKAC
jgi:hypothetical protein